MIQKKETIQAQVALFLLVAVAAGPLSLPLAGCRRTPGARLLYGALERRDGRTTVRLAFDRPVDSPRPSLIAFEPPPRGGFEVVAGPGAELTVLFDDPDPFPDTGRVVAVFRPGAGRRSERCELLSGIPNPVLRGVTWRDANRNKLVDEGDFLVLKFSAPVTVRKREFDPNEEFFLEGNDQLGEVAPGKAASRLRNDPSDPESVDLVLGEGAYLRPSREGETEGSVFGLNASFAAPSSLICARDSGLGAVSAAPGRRAVLVPVRVEPGFKVFTRLGEVRLGPSGGNENPTVTFCRHGSRCVVVSAGGRDPRLKREARGGIFVFSPRRPEPLLWEGTFSEARYGHCAVSLPVPEWNSLTAAVLFLGGVRALGKPVRSAELLCVKEEGDAEIMTLFSDSLPALEPRRDAEAVYVPKGAEKGYVVLTGGEGTRWGSVEILHVSWPRGNAPTENGGRALFPRIEYRGLFTPPDFPSRTEHSLTAMKLPDGTGAALIFGGKVGQASVALPFVVVPSKAVPGARSDDCIFVPGRAQEGLARHGHRAVYLPRRRRVVIMGGTFSLTRWDQTEVPIDAALEFDPATQLFTAYPGTVHEYRLDPDLVVLPRTERIVILGGRDRYGHAFRNLHVYRLPPDTRSLPSLLAVGSPLPEAVEGVRGAFVKCGSEDGSGKLYVVGERGGSVWSVRFPDEEMPAGKSTADSPGNSPDKSKGKATGKR